MRRLTAACFCVAGLLVSRAALADPSGCEQAEIPASALKGLQKAAKRESVEALDPGTLSYCTYRESGLATVDAQAKGANAATIGLVVITHGAFSPMLTAASRSALS